MLVNETQTPGLAPTLLTNPKSKIQNQKSLWVEAAGFDFRLEDFDGSGMNVPAFVVDRMQMVLPAFGSLTGGRAVPSAAGRRLFAVAAGRVVEAK